MKKQILVIDDDSTIRFLLQSILSVYDVVTKVDGENAIAWLNAGNVPDLIIMDMEMPNLTGVELIKRIKFSSKHRNVPIVVMSGNDNKEVECNFLRLGAADYIVKPFSSQDFQSRVKIAIENLRNN